MRCGTQLQFVWQVDMIWMYLLVVMSTVTGWECRQDARHMWHNIPCIAISSEQTCCGDTQCWSDKPREEEKKEEKKTKGNRHCCTYVEYFHWMPWWRHPLMWQCSTGCLLFESLGLQKQFASFKQLRDGSPAISQKLQECMNLLGISVTAGEEGGVTFCTSEGKDGIFCARISWSKAHFGDARLKRSFAPLQRRNICIALAYFLTD